MKQFDLHDIYWWCGRAAQNLGMLGLAGIVQVLACALLIMTKVLPEKATLAEANEALAHAPVQAINTPEAPPVQQAAEKTSAEEVAAFYKMFPAGATLPKQLELMEKTAIKQKLSLSRGDYKLSKTKQGQLLRYEIVFPLVGSYAQIREFIADVLQKIPALALSDLQIKRENVMSPTVKARLVFTLFLQGDSWLK